MKNSRPGAALVAALLTLPALPAQARPELCEAAAERAAVEVGVPSDVLRTIALVETGRNHDGRIRPWPWAANLDGQGHWFDTREQALAFASQALAQGRDSLDLGCFQINWRWHGTAFDAPGAVLDPMESERYAARFLRRLHAELGDWEAAAGAYHSRTPAFASRYRARFARMRATLAPHASAQELGLAGAAPPPPALPETPAPDETPRINAFPLLVASRDGSATAVMASLFPTDAPRGPGLLPHDSTRP